MASYVIQDVGYVVWWRLKGDEDTVRYTRSIGMEVSPTVKLPLTRAEAQAIVVELLKDTRVLDAWMSFHREALPI